MDDATTDNGAADLPRPAPFIRDLIYTELTAVATIAGLVVVTRLLAHGLGQEQFGVFSLAKRLLFAAIPFATLSMGIAIPRYVALAMDARARTHLLLGGLLAGVAPSLVLLAAGTALSRPLGRLLFNSDRCADVVSAILITLVGYSLYTVLFSYYRGSGRMGRANLWQLAAVVVVPVIVAAARTRPVALAVLLMGAGYFAAAIPLAVWTARALARGTELMPVRAAIRELLRYGVPRVPGAFALAGLFALGPVLAPHVASIEESGYLVVGQYLLTVLEGGLTAFGLVVLPKVAALVARSREEVIREPIAHVFAFVLHVGLFATLHLVLWSDQIVLAWLGPEYGDAAPIAAVFATIVLPYAAFLMLRSVIDALEEKAVNTANLLAGLLAASAASVLLATLRTGAVGLAAGTALGFFILGASTARYLWRRLRPDPRCLAALPCLLLNLAFLLAASGVRYVTVGRTGRGVLVAAVVLSETALFALYCLCLRARKVAWLFELEKQLKSLRGGQPQG